MMGNGDNVLGAFGIRISGNEWRPYSKGREKLGRLREAGQ